MISGSANIRTFIIGYQAQDITLEMETTTGRYYLSKVFGKSLYENELDTFAYIVNAYTLYNNTSIGLYQRGRVFIIDNKVEYSNYIFKNNSFIYIYKDIKNYSTLSEFDSLSYTLTIEDDLSDSDIEVLQVIFNGSVVNSFNFNKTTKVLTLNEAVSYDYLNNISIIVGNKNIDPTKVKVLGDFMPHRKRSEGIEFIEENYIDVSKMIQDTSYNRSSSDLFQTKRVLNNVGIHNEATNIRTEFTIKFNKQISQQTFAYSGGLYGSGTYGTTITGIDDLVNVRRFRIVLYDEVLQDILIFNNCKVREDFSQEFSTINTVNLTIDANKEIKVSYLYIENEESEC